MKFCSNCGAMLNDQDAVCPKCGQSVMPAQADPFADIFVQNQEQPAESSQYPAYTEPQPYYSETPVSPNPFASEAPVSSEPYCYNAPVNPEPPAPKKKVKWWMIAVPVVLVLAIAVVLLWNPMMLRFAPEMVLANALSDVSGELAERNTGSPLLALSNVADEKGNYTMIMDMTGTDPTMGDIEIDAAVYCNMETVQRQLDFNIAYAGEYLDASIYIDAQRLTLASERLLKGEAYGITYETFSEDLRGNALFADMDEETLTALEEAVRMIEDTNAAMAEQGPISDEYAAVVTEFAAALEPVVDSAERTVSGKERKVDTIAYTVTFEELAGMLEQLLEIAEDDEAMKIRMTSGFASIEGGEELWSELIAEYDYMIDALKDTDGEMIMNFCLYKNKLVCFSVEMAGEFEEESFEVAVDMELGENPSVNDLVYTITVVNADGEEGVIEITQSTEKSEASFAETIEFIVNDHPYGDSTSAELSYSWDSSSGDLSIAVVADDAEVQLDMVLEATEEGIIVSIDDLFGMLADAGMVDAADYNDLPISLSLQVKKGADISAPDYKNIDQWTQEDILNLAMEMQNFGA